MRIEQNPIGYQPVRQPQRQEVEQASQFQELAKAAQAAQVQQAQPASGVEKNGAVSMSGPVSQPLSKYLSQDEKAMLSALFAPAQANYGVGAYQQGQSGAVQSAFRGQNLDLTT